MRIVSLACGRRAAPLQITDGVDRVACARCDAQTYVERVGGANSLLCSSA